jgi:uncharacterized iron-regulated protein
MKRTNRSLLFALLFAPAVSWAGSEHFHLPIGDPERRQKEIRISLDTIIDTRSGESLTPRELAERLADSRLVFLGESHTNHEFHQVQLRVIQELHRAGRSVLIGLEMYPYTQQEYLDGWVSGLYTEQGFVDLSSWYENWSYHWNYYRDIFLFARDRGLPMFAINTPREVISSVRKKGFDNLTEEEAAHIPSEIDTDSDEYRRLFKAFFDADDPLHAMLSEEQWDGMFRAQCTWDATMGLNAVRALEKHGGPDSVMVVLIGSGHVSYGLGIERQAKRWFDGGMASLIPIPIEDDEGDAIEAVQASYADYVWGLPPEGEPLYPSLGLSTTKVDGEDGLREVIHVSEDSVAERSGFEDGDVLLGMGDIQLTGKGPLNRGMAAMRWGDTATFKIRRDGAEQNLVVQFRRQPPADEADDNPETD